MTILADDPVAADVAALERIGACGEARRWLTDNRLTLAAGWRKCENGPWLLWLIGKNLWRNGDPFGTPEHRKLVGCLVEIVTSLAQPFWREADRPVLQDCVDTLAAYANGAPVDRETLREKRRAASAAADAADAAAAAYAAASAAAASAASADAAAYYAAAASAADASKKVSAEIVRSWYPEAPRL